MTTIAASAKEGVMVCDSRMQVDDQWWPSPKVFRVGSALVGPAGDAAQGKRFLAWLGRGRKGPKPKADSFIALVLDETGLYYWSSAPIPERIERGMHAVGSGGNAALGALLAGASCQDAVTIACQIDTNSGGDVQVHTL